MRPEDELEETEKKTAENASKEAVADTVEEAGEEAPEETESNGKRNYWWLALSFLFLFLAGGGYYALTSMGKEAQKLAGGDSYNQLSANSAAYSGGSLEKADNYFSSDEEDPLAASAVTASAAAADKRRALADRRSMAASGGGTGSGSAGYAAGGEEGGEEELQQAGASHRGAFEGKLEARISGLGGQRGPGAAKSSSGFNPGGEQSAGGAGVTAGRPSVQRETAAGAPKKASPGGVLNALKGAFRASLYGARVASKDSARHWMARTFDAAGDVNTSLEYDEKMKASLDRIDPNSIPKFLRDQDIAASDAKSLGVAEVGKPKMDVEGTKEALKNDKEYQAKKMAKDMASAAMNPIGNFVGANTARSGTPSDEETSEEDRGVTGFASPEDEAAFGEITLSEYIESNPNNDCECDGPCCCLPKTDNCPLYGPFLPNDPCGAAIYGGTSPLVGDFPPSNMSVMPA